MLEYSIRDLHKRAVTSWFAVITPQMTGSLANTLLLEVLLLCHGPQSFNDGAVCRQYDIHGISDALVLRVTSYTDMTCQGH